MRSIGFTACALALAASAAVAAPLTGEAAFGAWQDDRPGLSRLIAPADLPPPDETRSRHGFREPVLRPDNVTPKLPEGFSAQLVVSGLEGPRVMRVAPNGDIFIANSAANEIIVLRLEEGTPTIARRSIFADGLALPYGIAFYPPGDNPSWVYVANTNGVVRFPYSNGDLIAAEPAEVIVDDVPEGLHWTRDLVFAADGSSFYLSVGSGSNVARDMPTVPAVAGGLAAWKADKPMGATWGPEERQANVLSYDPDGGNEKIVATGLRNCSGLTLQAATGALWCVVNERDGLGDNTPFDYATRVSEGGFYGWPWYYIGANEDPRRRGERPDLADQVTVPDVLFQAHSAPLGIAFYDGAAFPEKYQGSAFVTFHGSWNREKRTGYKVVMLPFENGKPTGAYEDFMTGLVISDQEVWGRPVGVTVAKDGALLVSEDGNGTIWRVTYGGTK